MALEDRHVVVVGAGVGGMAAALLCARAGARVTLVERAARPETVGAGILLQPNALAVLYGLDLDERLRRRGRRVARLRVADSAGRTILEAPVPRFAEGLDHALVVRRSDLLAGLLDLIAAEPRLERRFGAEAVGVSRDGAVVVRSEGETRRMAGDLVVGADGVHSRVRKSAAVGARVGRGLRYARGIAAATVPGEMTEYWTDLGVFGVAPLPRGTYFYASTHAAPLRSAFEERDPALFRDAWAAALPAARPVLADLARLEDLVVNEVIRVDCRPWSDGRLVLLGDAAHAMAPNLGQGAASALVDAAVLVWELAQPGDPLLALPRYEARRRRAVRTVQDLAGRLARLSDLTNPLLRRLRDGAARLLAPWLVGEVAMRAVEQQDPLWLRMAAADPRGEAAP